MLSVPLFLIAAIQTKLVFIDLVLGTGVAAKKGDIVTLNYKGSLQDGKVFDDTEKKPPIAFELGKGTVIKGWDNGVPGMMKGGKRVLQIPPDLGYGAKGAGKDIPGGATLIFQVELLRIDSKEKKAVIEIEETQEGTGNGAENGDIVKVHYTGSFVNGTKFDSSLDRNQPLDVTIGKTGLIAGFTQGLIGLKVGGKRRVTIPYQLAYGEQGRPPVIPPMATLVFDLELVSNQGK